MRQGLILVYALLVLSCHRSDNEDFIPFSGVTYDEDTGYILHQDKLENGEPRANLMGVLTYYGVSCKFDLGQISILSKDTSGLNLLYNITIKAQDPEWIRSHLVPR
jgi:hypothetical protein